MSLAQGDQGAAGLRALLPRLAPGGGAEDADEQPRPGGRRAPRGPGRLRRNRPRRPLLGGLRRDRPHPARAGRRRDHAGPVGKAGRRLPHPRVGAAGADRQLEPGPRLGDLGGVPPARGDGPDDVRADDRGLLDLHRQPGDRPGHIRVLRRDRPPPLRRLPEGDDHAHRRARRHGRRPAAGGDHERRRRPLRRDRPTPDRPAARDPLPRRGGRRPRGRRGPLRGRQGGGAGAQRRSLRQRRRRAAGPAGDGLRAPTSSPTRPAPTTRWSATCRT